MNEVPVTIYHDETKRADETRLKGHVLLFVPHVAEWTSETPLFGRETRTIRPIDDVPRLIWALRRAHRLETKRLHFSKIGGRKWTKFDAGHRAIADLVADTLRCRPGRSLPVPFGLKVAVMFYGPDADLSLYSGTHQERVLRHDETVLRMLLKGAVHYLFPERAPIRIVELVTDGQPAHRSLSETRVLWRLAADTASGRSPLRDNVQLPEDVSLRPHSSDHKAFVEGTAEDNDSQFLQLADMLLGAISRSCFDEVTEWVQSPPVNAETAQKKDVIAHPIREVLLKQARGSGFRHSSHYRSFSVGRVQFSTTDVSFSRLSPRLADPTLPSPQLDLSWDDGAP